MHADTDNCLIQLEDHWLCIAVQHLMETRNPMLSFHQIISTRSPQDHVKILKRPKDLAKTPFKISARFFAPSFNVISLY